MTRNLGLKGRHKLHDQWNSCFYIVAKKIPNLPVYRLKPESGTSSERTFHRGHLLPIGEFVRFPTLIKCSLSDSREQNDLPSEGEMERAVEALQQPFPEIYLKN